MKSLKNIFPGVVTILIALFVGIGAVQAQETVVDVINESEDHTVFAELLEETELEGLLEQEGPYTVLAPTDDAFEAMGDDLEELKGNTEELQNVVIGHLYNGQVTAADMEQAKSIEIENGDIEAGNGTVHVIEEVLVE